MKNNYPWHNNSSYLSSFFCAIFLLFFGDSSPDSSAIFPRSVQKNAPSAPFPYNWRDWSQSKLDKHLQPTVIVNMYISEKVICLFWIVQGFNTVYIFFSFSGREAKATLGDVLAFATGADVPPTLGFDTTPTISFVDGAFPTANTCSATIRLPTIHDTYDDFKEKMDFAILNSPSFGQP